MTKKKKKKAIGPQRDQKPVQARESPARRPFLPAAAILIIFALIGLYLFRHAMAVLTAGAYSGMNILLITLDTTRADHLPMYGYQNVKTPNLDALAQTSFVFDDAVSHVPITLPSHCSILTG